MVVVVVVVVVVLVVEVDLVVVEVDVVVAAVEVVIGLGLVVEMDSVVWVVGGLVPVGFGWYFDDAVVVGFLFIKSWPCLLTPAVDILFCVGSPGNNSHSKSKLNKNLKPPFLL